jgi:acyl carrier protein
MILPALPVTPNGKINRAALPRPEAPAREPVASAAPRTATERTLTRIFAEILSRESIGLDDNFFDLGGQSLKAIQMLSRIRGELSREIAVVDIFNAPTPRALAQKLEDAGAVHEDVIPALPLRPWYIASHAQKRIWLASRGADSSAYNMAGALQIEGPLDSEQLSRALASLVDRHESLRTVFAMIEGELKQKILTRENAGFRLERLSLETELDAVIREEASLPFDLASGPLFRARLIQLSAQTHVLLLTLHHIVADAWSIRILTEELRALYASNPLPPLTIQYRDYAEWHNVYLRGEKTQAHRAYWLEKLAPPVPRLEFPIDHVRPPRLSHVGRSLDLALTGSKVAALAALARTHQTSLYTVVLSSICVLLHRYTGSEDMVIGSAHAGRDREQLESQIGVFLNTVVLRIPLQKSMTLEEVIRAVSKASSEALEHGAYPFDLLLEDLRVRTPANRFPLFDIQVDYIPALETQQDSRITDLAPTESATKFDLSFHITEERDRLLIRFIYNASLFKPETIVVLRERLTKIQDAFSQDPHVRIDRISLAGAATAPKRKVRVALRLKQ